MSYDIIAPKKKSMNFHVESFLSNKSKCEMSLLHYKNIERCPNAIFLFNMKTCINQYQQLDRNYTIYLCYYAVTSSHPFLHLVFESSNLNQREEKEETFMNILRELVSKVWNELLD